MNENKHVSPYKPNSLTSFRDEINSFFDRFSRDLNFSGENSNFTPRVEVKDTGTTFQVSAELPGMEEKDINVSLENNILVLEGERKKEFKSKGEDYYRSEFSYGSFYRSIPLSADVNPDKVNANYENGVLKVTLEKTQPTQPKTKKINIGDSKTSFKQ